LTTICEHFGAIRTILPFHSTVCDVFHVLRNLLRLCHILCATKVIGGNLAPQYPAYNVNFHASTRDCMTFVVATHICFPIWINRWVVTPRSRFLSPEPVARTATVFASSRISQSDRRCRLNPNWFARSSGFRCRIRLLALWPRPALSWLQEIIEQQHGQNLDDESTCRRDCTHSKL